MTDSMNDKFNFSKRDFCGKKVHGQKKNGKYLKTWCC